MVGEVAVVHQVAFQIQAHGVDEVALRCRLEHGKQAVGVLRRGVVVTAHAQICFYFPSVQPDGVHQCRLTVVQVGILFRHAHHIVPQQFAHRTEEILHEEEETEQTPKRRLIKIGRHTTIANHTDGGDDKGSKPDKTYHKEEDRQQRRYLIDEDELQKMVGTHGGEIKETRDDDTLRHEYCERKGLGKREPLLDIERQRKRHAARCMPLIESGSGSLEPPSPKNCIEMMVTTRTEWTKYTMMRCRPMVFVARDCRNSDTVSVR